MTTPDANPRRDRAPWVFSLGAAAFIVRVVGPLWRGGLPSFFPDSSSFTKVARIGPISPSFWFSERPVGLPLVLWTVGFDVRWLVVVQSLAYALAVTLVCATLLRILESRPLAWVASLAVTAIAVQPRFAMWCVEVLSESVGLSTSMLALALWLRFAHSPGRRSMVAATAATIAFLLTRDSHSMSALIVALVLAGAAWRTRDADSRRTALRCAIALMVALGYVAVSQGTSDRNQYPLINNVGLRILPDAAMTESFVAHGMPMSDALLDRTGSNTWDDGETFLNAPELAGFRGWVRGSGQLDQMTSLLTDAGFWIDVMRRELPGALRYDFGDYDRFGVGDRLPSRLAWFSGIDSTGTLWWFVVLAGSALWVVARRSRRLALILGTGLVASLVELYASIATDAVEVQRHTIGPMLRVNVVCIVSLFLAVDVLLRRRSNDHTPVRDSWAHVSAALAATVATLGWFAIERRSQDYDPQYARTIVERAARFGGTYYENGIHNKGPLETVVYDSARWFTSYDTYWFAIASYCLVISLTLGAASWAVARRFAGHRTAAAVSAAVTVVHFFMSSSDYAGVVYSRNITTALLAAVVVVALWDRPWRDPRLARLLWIGAVASLGLAVQTLLTSVLAAFAVGFLLAHRRRYGSGFSRPRLVAASTFVATVLSAPVWYSLRGRFDQFWSGWWTYASFMSDGTGRGYAEQIGLGWNTMIDYYSERPESVLIVVVFVAGAIGRRHALDTTQRAVAVSLTAWFVGGWGELVLGQRYSSHYFSVIAVPTALMFAVIVAWLSRALSHVANWTAERRSPGDRRIAHAPVIVAVAVALFAQCGDLFWDGATRAGNFHSFAAETREREQAMSGQSRSVRAVLDLVSDDGDALLAWTMYPWTYLDNHRVPATRFSWKSFMIGEIYLGDTSADYVLPRTWQWFAEDLDRTKPAAYLRPVETPLVEDTPFARLVESDFTPVFAGATVELSVRSRIWESLVNFEGRSDERGTIDGTCWRWRGTIDGLTDDRRLGFTFVDPDGSNETVHMSVGADRSWSSSDTVEFLSVARTPSPSASVQLLVGPRSAVLVVDDTVAAAVRLDGPTSVTISDDAGVVSGAASDDMPALAACVNS
ncbi:MAG: hypothetical protein ACKOHN_04290 [Actinomycetota bacterium]